MVDNKKLFLEVGKYPSKGNVLKSSWKPEQKQAALEQKLLKVSLRQIVA